jgi:two-component system response regulator AtoC
MAEPNRRRGRVLVVEDESYVRLSLGDLLEARGFDFELAASVPEALECLAKAPVDLVLTDLKMPGSDGLSLVRKIAERHPDLPVIVLTGFGTVASAVECLRAGASDYILKPADPDALEVALERALRQRSLEREVRYLRSAGPEPIDTDMPVGESPVWLEVIRKVRAAAATDATVLLRGESGTGKDLLARLLHRLSARAEGPHVRVNCAATPLEMWESEFFGHRKGSFTGATADREGRFRLADGGTLFMDEVGAMPLPAQAKILRVLQDGEFDRLGDRQTTRVDVRVVAATNSDLEDDIANGTFRQDLFFRLNVVPIHVPPLRERSEDIPLLADKFVREISARIGRKPPHVSADVLSDLATYPWPGNVRELRNVLERTLILNPEDTLASLDLPPVQGSATGSVTPAAAGTPSGDLNLRRVLARREREIIILALRHSGGVRKKAAQLLGIDQRNLGYYLQKHDIDPDRLPQS